MSKAQSTDAELPEATLSRRTMLRTAAAAGAAGAGLGAAGTASADKLVDCEFVTTTGGALAGGGIGGPGGAVAGGVVGYNVGQAVCPNEIDHSAEQEEADFDNWVEIYNVAREHSTEDSTVIESFQRDINTASNAARRQGLYTLYEQAASGVSESDTQSAVETAVDDYYAEVEKAIWNHYEARYGKYTSEAAFIASSDFTTAGNKVAQVRDHSSNSLRDPTGTIQDSNGNPLFDYDFLGGNSGMDPDQTNDLTLPNGDVVSISGPHMYGEGGGGGMHEAIRTAHIGKAEPIADSIDGSRVFLSNVLVEEPDPDEYDAVDSSEIDTSNYAGQQELINFRGFYDMVQSLREEHTASKNEVSVWMDQYYEDAANDEIDLTQMVGNAGLLETARNADNFREAALALRIFGFPRSETALRLEFDDPNGDGKVTTDAYLAWSLAEDNTLPVGSPIDPNTLPGTFYVAYNLTDADGNTTGSIGELVDSFTIIATEDPVGGEVGFEANGTVDTSMSPSRVRDEFEESGQAKQDAENARQDINTESSGIGLPTIGGVAASVWVPVALIGGGVLLIWDKISGS